MIIDKYLYSKYLYSQKVKTPLFFMGTIVTYSLLQDHLDLRVKERGKCDNELKRFGECLEKYNDKYEKCSEFLEEYKRCLQK